MLMNNNDLNNSDLNNSDLIGQLHSIAGKRHVHTDARKSERFRKGFRSGEGEALAVVLPGTLLEMWRVLQLAVEANKIVIMQAANTGLTEGSTPNGQYDRDVIIINTLRLDKIHLIEQGRQVVSHPGGTLYKLEKLLKPLNREPHSVIGSSCLGASIVGGVCNNSGGSLVQRGPVYTELSLYAQRQADGTLVLVNHLGIDLGDTPETMLERLEKGEFADADVSPDAGKASTSDYQSRVREVDAATPARFNADPSHLHESSGCAGKLAVFAVRLDTFASQSGDRTYYLGTNDPAELTTLRRRVLAELPELPISGEYLHRDCFDIARTYGKDTLLMIHWLGTDFLPFFFSLKGQVDARMKRLPFVSNHLSDKILQFCSRLLPEALPARMLAYREQFEHHLILKVAGSISEDTEQLLNDILGSDGWFECDDKEAKKAMLHRFAAAGAAVRYQAIHADEVEDIIALDIALRRNDTDWIEKLPADVDEQFVTKLYYGHFFCHVFHQDYVVRKGGNPQALKARMLSLLNERGAEYPAEHNVGHLYEAKPALADFYSELDPTNSFNPGIGKTSRQQRMPDSYQTDA